jgi:hypothetical protein
MRNLARLALTGAAVSIAATACGGSSNVLQGKSPTQIVQLAGTSITSSSYHLALQGTIGFDAGSVTGLPPGALDQMTTALKNATIDGSGDFQDAKHARLQMTVKPALDTPVQMVLFEDHAYISQDGGKTWADMGSFNFSGLPASPSDATAELNGLSNVQDQGSAVRNGVKVEHMHATLPANYVQQQLGKAGGSGQLGQMLQQLGSVMADAFQVKDSSVDAYVRSSDGKLDSLDTHMTMAIDMGKFLKAIMQALGGQIPGAAGADASALNAISGSLNMNAAVSQTYTNYGEKVTVEKPTVDPNAPTPPALFGA